MKALKPIDFTCPKTQENITNLIKDAVRVEYGEVVQGHNMNDIFLNFGTSKFLTKHIEDLEEEDLE